MYVQGIPFKLLEINNSELEVRVDRFLKFSFSEKATKMCAIVRMVLTFT